MVCHTLVGITECIASDLILLIHCAAHVVKPNGLSRLLSSRLPSRRIVPQTPATDLQAKVREINEFDITNS